MIERHMRMVSAADIKQVRTNLPCKCDAFVLGFLIRQKRNSDLSRVVHSAVLPLVHSLPRMKPCTSKKVKGCGLWPRPCCFLTFIRRIQATRPASRKMSASRSDFDHASKSGGDSYQSAPSFFGLPTPSPCLMQCVTAPAGI